MRNIRYTIGQTSAAILTIFGLIFLPARTYDISHSIPMTIAMIVVVLGILAIAIAYYYFPSFAVYRAGYGRYPTPAIITKRASTIRINKAFNATIVIDKELIFFDDPKQDDLVDFVDTLPGNEIAKASYRSPDSHISAFTTKSPHQLIFYWKPKSPIAPFVGYCHRNQNDSPSPYGPDGFYHSILFDRETGVSDLSLKLPVPLEDVVAFVMPRHITQVTENILYRYGIKRSHKGCAQPNIGSKKREVSWKLERPLIGRRYVIFGLYEGERASFMERMAKRNRIARLREFAGRLFTRIARPNDHDGQIE